MCYLLYYSVLKHGHTNNSILAIWSILHSASSGMGHQLQDTVNHRTHSTNIETGDPGRNPHEHREENCS